MLSVTGTYSTPFGVVAGYLVWSGMVPSSAHAISIVEQINSRQMGPPGRELVAIALTMGLSGPTERGAQGPSGPTSGPSEKSGP